ncbi:MAG: metal dependent phosphohydrolase [Verrucomicrobiaceae bacterium]|nr:metal dependent phosphohydrolase [Verrucomicrobiaceae bacterium]
MLKWIDTKQLRLGMFVCELGGSWVDHPFWRNKFLLKTREELALIRDAGIARVRIDIGKGLDIVAVAPAAAVVAVPTPEPAKTAVAQVRMDEELARAARICTRGKEAVMSMFQEVRMGNAIDVVDIAPLVEEIASSMARHPHALLSLARLKTQDDYTYLHSVAVCALMIALARQLQLDDALTRSAGLAGLLHDMGKATSPLEILNKPGKLTEAEFAVMRQHPEAGHAMLLEARGTDSIALDVCLHHHEKIDGSGYPHRLSGDQISLFAKMGAVCDVYDAVTSERPYNKGWDPSEALRRMAEWRGHFDPAIFQAFVKSLGIYPIGSLVRLESGRLAVVIEQGKKSLTTPIVKVFFSTKAKCHLMPKLLDLSKSNCDDKIVARESAETWGLVNLDELWGGVTPAAT